MIHGKVTIKLTRKQTTELRKFWSEKTEGKGPCYCIGQAMIRMGPFWVEPAQAEFIVVDSDMGSVIQAGLDAHKKGDIDGPPSTSRH